METVMTLLLVRFGLVVLGVVVLVLVAVVALAVVRRSLRTSESRERASSMLRSAAETVERRSSGRVTGMVARRAGDLAADRLGRGDA